MGEKGEGQGTRMITETGAEMIIDHMTRSHLQGQESNSKPTGGPLHHPLQGEVALGVVGGHPNPQETILIIPEM